MGSLPDDLRAFDIQTGGTVHDEMDRSGESQGCTTAAVESPNVQEQVSPKQVCSLVATIDAL